MKHKKGLMSRALRAAAQQGELFHNLLHTPLVVLLPGTKEKIKLAMNLFRIPIFNCKNWMHFSGHFRNFPHLIRVCSLCFQLCAASPSPEQLLAERLLLLRGDLSGGKSRRLQRLPQPLG